MSQFEISGHPTTDFYNMTMQRMREQDDRMEELHAKDVEILELEQELANHQTDIRALLEEIARSDEKIRTLTDDLEAERANRETQLQLQDRLTRTRTDREPLVAQLREQIAQMERKAEERFKIIMEQQTGLLRVKGENEQLRQRLNALETPDVMETDALATLTSQLGQIAVPRDHPERLGPTPEERQALQAYQAQLELQSRQLQEYAQARATVEGVANNLHQQVQRLQTELQQAQQRATEFPRLFAEWNADAPANRSVEPVGDGSSSSNAPPTAPAPVPPTPPVSNTETLEGLQLRQLTERENLEQSLMTESRSALDMLTAARKLGHHQSVEDFERRFNQFQTDLNRLTNEERELQESARRQLQDMADQFRNTTLDQRVGVEGLIQGYRTGYLEWILEMQQKYVDLSRTVEVERTQLREANEKAARDQAEAMAATNATVLEALEKQQQEHRLELQQLRQFKTDAESELARLRFQAKEYERDLTDLPNVQRANVLLGESFGRARVEADQLRERQELAAEARLRGASRALEDAETQTDVIEDALRSARTQWNRVQEELRRRMEPRLLFDRDHDANWQAMRDEEHREWMQMKREWIQQWHNLENLARTKLASDERREMLQFVQLQESDRRQAIEAEETRAYPPVVQFWYEVYRLRRSAVEATEQSNRQGVVDAENQARTDELGPALTAMQEEFNQFLNRVGDDQLEAMNQYLTETTHTPEEIQTLAQNLVALETQTRTRIDERGMLWFDDIEERFAAHAATSAPDIVSVEPVEPTEPMDTGYEAEPDQVPEGGRARGKKRLKDFLTKDPVTARTTLPPQSVKPYQIFGDINLLPDVPYTGELVPLRRDGPQHRWLQRQGNPKSTADSRKYRHDLGKLVAGRRHIPGSVTSEEMENMRVVPGLTFGIPLERTALGRYRGDTVPGQPGKRLPGRPRTTVQAQEETTGEILDLTAPKSIRMGRVLKPDRQILDEGDDDVVYFTMKERPEASHYRPFTTTWRKLRDEIQPRYMDLTSRNDVIGPQLLTYSSKTKRMEPNMTIFKTFYRLRGVRMDNEWMQKYPQGLTKDQADRLERIQNTVFPAQLVANIHHTRGTTGQLTSQLNRVEEARRAKELRKEQIKKKYQERARILQIEYDAKRMQQEAYEKEIREAAEEEKNEWNDLENVDIADLHEEDESDTMPTSTSAPLPPILSRETPTPSRTVAAAERVRTPSPVRREEQAVVQQVAVEVGLEAESDSSGSSSASGKGKERERAPTPLGVPVGDPSRNIFLRTGPDGIPAPLPEEGVVMGTRLRSPPASPPSQIPATRPAPKPAPKIDETHRRRIATERGREWGGGGEAPVGELPRDILNVPDNQQRIFRDLRGAYVAAGIHGRMAQVRPPPPPPEATGEDQSDDENSSTRGDREPRNWADYYSAGHAVELVQSIQPAPDATAEERQRTEQYRNIMMGSMVQRGLERAKKSGVSHTNKRL